MFKKNINWRIAFLCIWICLLFLLVSSCEQVNNEAQSSINGGAVILTFDDVSVRDWYNVDHILSKYNWKATFFISHFNSLDEEDIERLTALQSKGHEIGSHSENHLNAKQFISDHSIPEYIDAEILPSINAMNDKGFAVNSFAYPYGKRNKKLDRALLRHFKILRGTTDGKRKPSHQNNYANGSRIVFGLGIDEHYGNDSEYLLEILEYVKENNKIVIFYGHRVAQENNPPKYTTSYRILETICNYVVINNMRFMTMNDLVFNNPK